MALAAVLTLAACTPEEQLWYSVLGRVPAGMACGQWAGTARVAGWRDDELATLGRIMRRESRCNPQAINHRSGDYGLTQIHHTWIGSLCAAGIACTLTELLYPGPNLRAARYVHDVQGWQAWATYH